MVAPLAALATLLLVYAPGTGRREVAPRSAQVAAEVSGATVRSGFGRSMREVAGEVLHVLITARR
jgi:hypothetical protein